MKFYKFWKLFSQVDKSFNGDKLFAEKTIAELDEMTNGFYNRELCTHIYYNYVESCKDNNHIVVSLQCIRDDEVDEVDDTDNKWETERNRVFLINYSNRENPQYIDLVSIIEKEKGVQDFSWEGVTASCFK